MLSMAESRVEQRVEQRVDQARKYVERNRGWRPHGRTVLYLAVMVVALVLSAVFVPRFLPGKLQNAETLLGRDGGISIVPLGGGAVRPLIAAAPKGEGYSTWAISQSREEVAVGWFHESGGKVDKVSIQSRSAYSGRLQAEWVLAAKDVEPRVQQVGFLPQHNQIWFLSSGKFSLVDIKSGAIIDFPFRGPGGLGEIPAPTGVTYASFSLKGGRLAYARGGRLTVVTGLASGRGDKKIVSRDVIDPGVTRDTAGTVVTGTVSAFAWLDDATLAVILAQSPGTSAIAPTVLNWTTTVTTPIYIVKLGADGGSVIDPAVPAPASVRFISISHAPEGTDFVVFAGSGVSPGNGAQGKFSVTRYTAPAKPGNPIKLPAGNWAPPVSWTSP